MLHEAGAPRALAQSGKRIVEIEKEGPDDPRATPRGAEADNARRDARRRRCHLPGDLLRRPLARPCRLPVQGRASEPTSVAWSYDIADTKLARGVKASRDPPDVRLRGPAGTACRALAPESSMSSPATGRASPTVSLTTRRTTALSKGGSRPASWPVLAARRRTPTRSTIAVSASGTRRASPSPRRRPPVDRGRACDA